MHKRTLSRGLPIIEKINTGLQDLQMSAKKGLLYLADLPRFFFEKRTFNKSDFIGHALITFAGLIVLLEGCGDQSPTTQNLPVGNSGNNGAAVTTVAGTQPKNIDDKCFAEFRPGIIVKDPISGRAITLKEANKNQVYTQGGQVLSALNSNAGSMKWNYQNIGFPDGKFVSTVIVSKTIKNKESIYSPVGDCPTNKEDLPIDDQYKAQRKQSSFFLL